MSATGAAVEPIDLARLGLDSFAGQPVAVLVGVELTFTLR